MCKTQHQIEINSFWPLKMKSVGHSDQFTSNIFSDFSFVQVVHHPSDAIWCFFCFLSCMKL